MFLSLTVSLLLVTGKPDGVEQYENIKEPFVQVSTDLANLAHLDPGDAGRSHAVWKRLLYQQPEPTGWYFLFPDVGLALELCNGACISWDGRQARHCTSIASHMHSKDMLLSYYFGLSQKLLNAQARLHAFAQAQQHKRSHLDTYPPLEPSTEVWVGVRDCGKLAVKQAIVIESDSESVLVAFRYCGKYDPSRTAHFAHSDINIVIAGYDPAL